MIGYLLPDLLLARATRAYQKSIQNGLPDALDLIVVCVEAGSSLDQAIVRASEELEIALPALAQELRTVTGEIRAGKPRVEAFHDLARRTQLEDVRSLVAMLTQTDRFGTSIAQALRTHAATSRSKRRQRAEERASKVGVKLVFPLALCLVPALYSSVSRTNHRANHADAAVGRSVFQEARRGQHDHHPARRFRRSCHRVHDEAAEPSAQPGLALARSSVRQHR